MLKYHSFNTSLPLSILAADAIATTAVKILSRNISERADGYIFKNQFQILHVNHYHFKQLLPIPE